MVRISKGNNKIGTIANISPPPVITCRANAPCAKQCYALKAYKCYAKTTSAPTWDNNLAEYRRSPVGYFKDIIAQLDKLNPSFFRWHVSGDIIDAQYLYGMRQVAIAHPGTNFMAFTKRYDIVTEVLLDVGALPRNLHVILSAWPGLPMYNPYNLPIAYMQDGTEDRISPDSRQCPGKCTTCNCCWNMKNGESVWFKKH